MEKFLKVCWKYDQLAGESNCNINDDFSPGTLFYSPENSNKKESIKQEIKTKILAGTIKSNKDGMRYVLSLGGLPILFVEIITELKDTNRVKIIGKFNRQVTSIHKLDEYNIQVI